MGGRPAPGPAPVAPKPRPQPTASSSKKGPRKYAIGKAGQGSSAIGSTVSDQNMMKRRSGRKSLVTKRGTPLGTDLSQDTTTQNKNLLTGDKLGVQ